jgi:hypothetical protein
VPYSSLIKRKRFKKQGITKKICTSIKIILAQLLKSISMKGTRDGLSIFGCDWCRGDGFMTATSSTSIESTA